MLNGFADEILKYKQKLQETLHSKDSISIDELKDCDNINPYKDWFMNILTESKALQSSINTEFMNEIDNLSTAQYKLHDMLN